jgi:hypothetical protein
VGRPIAAFLPADDAGKKVTITNPEGIVFDATVEKKGDHGVVEFAQTQRPGLYTLKPPGGLPVHYVVNASRRESDLQKLSDKEVADLAASHGVSLVHSGAEYKALESARRFGSEFWKSLLWVLLGFTFLELFLQQRFAGGRSKP